MSTMRNELKVVENGVDGVSVDRLYRELVGNIEEDATDAEGETTDQRTEQMLTAVLDTLFPDEPFAFEEDLVKGNLDEILILLVAMRETDTHGKGLMEDLSLLFDARLSPGTVYPQLHDLDEDGILEMYELVRTKEYRVDDLELAKERVHAAMRQHLALGFFFFAALAEL